MSSLYLCLLFALTQLAGEILGQGSRTYLPAAMEPIITKQFYSISPAEDPEEAEPHTKHLVIGQPRRNYRVIFIRAPGSNSERVKYTAELAPQEERTVIYVLTRKQPELEAADIRAPQERPQAEQKPDIFFIKYKTNEEAAAAQKEIQTQYDQLGGNSEIAAPYVAPVKSVIGSQAPQSGYQYQNPNQYPNQYQNQYQNQAPSAGGYHYEKPTSTLLAPVERSF